MPALVLGEPPPVPSSLPLVFIGLFSSSPHINPIVQSYAPSYTRFREAPPASLMDVLCLECNQPRPGSPWPSLREATSADPSPTITTLPENTMQEHFL